MCFCDGNDTGYVNQTKRRVCGRLYPYELENVDVRGITRSLPDGRTDLSVVTEGTINLGLVSILEVKKCCL